MKGQGLSCDRLPQIVMPRLLSLPDLAHKQFNKIFCFILLLFAGLQMPVYANDYEIELIVFERSNSQDIQLEHWDFSDEYLETRRSKIESMKKSRKTVALTDELFHLDGFMRRLNNNHLPVLASARWVQPSSFFQHAPVVSVGVEGSRLSHAYFRIYKTSLLFADIALQLSTDRPVLKPNFNLPEFTIKDQQTALFSPEPIEEDSDFNLGFLFDSWSQAETENTHYFLIEKRRIRFEEIHYFDHPAFGVILGVWSVES